jgi:hypothetical protein
VGLRSFLRAAGEFEVGAELGKEFCFGGACGGDGGLRSREGQFGFGQLFGRGGEADGDGIVLCAELSMDGSGCGLGCRFGRAGGAEILFRACFRRLGRRERFVKPRYFDDVSGREVTGFFF